MLKPTSYLPLITACLGSSSLLHAAADCGPVKVQLCEQFGPFGACVSDTPGDNKDLVVEIKDNVGNYTGNKCGTAVRSFWTMVTVRGKRIKFKFNINDECGYWIAGKKGLATDK